MKTMKMIDEVVTVARNERITPHLYVIAFESERLAHSIQPGQFLQVAVTEDYDPFLRRPFTIYRVLRNRLEILYEIVGQGSEILSRKVRGDRLKVMGPLGNTFSMRMKNRIHVIVGGGVGIAPFIFLGQKIKIDHFLMGARSKKGLLPKSEIGALWSKSRFTTEDGSYGRRGFITECLEEVIKECRHPRRIYLYVCGPRAMMRAVREMTDRHGLEGEASVDERMACGVGACLGCVVETTNGYKTSCREGTVFRLRDLIL